MKKIISIIISFICIFAITASSTNGDVLPNTITDENVKNTIDIEVDGVRRSIVAYNIDGNNYFKLRDVANIHKGSKAHFDVLWNEEIKAIELISKTDYSTIEKEDELKTEKIEILKKIIPVYLDGEGIIIESYDILGNNYFKLRDIASAIDFNVKFNDSNNVIEIDTSNDYIYPNETSDKFALNKKYLSYIGKPKSFIDKHCGSKGTHYGYFGEVDYGEDIGLDIVYGREWVGIENEVPDTSRVAWVRIALDKLFFNCPETLTVEKIQSVLPKNEYSCNGHDGIFTLDASYSTAVFFFTLDTGLKKTDYATIMFDPLYSKHISGEQNNNYQVEFSHNKIKLAGDMVVFHRGIANGRPVAHNYSDQFPNYCTFGIAALSKTVYDVKIVSVFYNNNGECYVKNVLKNIGTVFPEGMIQAEFELFDFDTRGITYMDEYGKVHAYSINYDNKNSSVNVKTINLYDY